jgi:hypothetical protein
VYDATLQVQIECIAVLSDRLIARTHSHANTYRNSPLLKQALHCYCTNVWKPSLVTRHQQADGGNWVLVQLYVSTHHHTHTHTHTHTHNSDIATDVLLGSGRWLIVADLRWSGCSSNGPALY